MRQHRRVDLVGLDRRVGDRLDLQWVGENDIIANVVEPVVHHHLVAGGLHHSTAVLAIPLQKRTERLAFVRTRPDRNVFPQESWTIRWLYLLW